jgi:hypothetical protein
MVDPSVCPPKADVELADVVRRFGTQYISQYGHRMMPSQKRALSDIAACCTKELGGRLYRCDDCRDTFWHYHCCRNRACPKCHGSQTRQWLQQRQAELLPCDYFHAVVTVPKELRAAFRRNQKLLYGLLMQVSATAVKDLCAHKRHLGGLPGMLSVLHTWNGQLGYHPHVHLLLTGGGITADGQHWEPARGEFLVPVAVLSRKIAAQFCTALKAAAPAVFVDIPAGVWQRNIQGHALRGGRRGSISRNDKHENMGGAAIRNGLRPLEKTFVTLLGTAPGGQWGGFDRTLARACSHTRCRCQAVLDRAKPQRLFHTRQGVRTGNAAPLGRLELGGLTLGIDMLQTLLDRRMLARFRSLRDLAATGFKSI